MKKLLINKTINDIFDVDIDTLLQPYSKPIQYQYYIWMLLSQKDIFDYLNHALKNIDIDELYKTNLWIVITESVKNKLPLEPWVDTLDNEFIIRYKDDIFDKIELNDYKHYLIMTESELKQIDRRKKIMKLKNEK